MTVKSKPYYWLVCDHPGCGANSTEGADISGWGEIYRAEDEARSCEWYVEGGVHLCPEHAPKTPADPAGSTTNDRDNDKDNDHD